MPLGLVRCIIQYQVRRPHHGVSYTVYLRLTLYTPTQNYHRGDEEEEGGHYLQDFGYEISKAFCRTDT